MNGPRWEPYVLARGEEFKELWKNHCAGKARQILFVLGSGFDPRMCVGVEAVLAAGGNGKRDCLLVMYDEGDASPSQKHSDMVESNLKELRTLFRGRGDIRQERLSMWSTEGKRIASRQASQLFGSFGNVRGFTDIVVDISALPRSLYLPIVGKLLYLIDAQEEQGQRRSSLPALHVVVAENMELDRSIHEEGIDEDAVIVHGFHGDLDLEATEDVPRVWIPVLGEGKEVQLERIYHRVRPSEVCPVLPCPSVDPRRGDSLLVEYRRFLFDGLRVEARNFIYAPEQNPFAVYRNIRRTILHYQAALEALGGCKAVVSAVSSKLLSIGAMLACYELMQSDYRVGMVQVEPNGYTLRGDSRTPEGSELFTICLTGECYDE